MKTIFLMFILMILTYVRIVYTLGDPYFAEISWRHKAWDLRAALRGGERISKHYMASAIQSEENLLCIVGRCFMMEPSSMTLSKI
ncbi:hypothetical protein BX600DRAFT_113042 [Xylariales sp. PMI_506]|nr:hypothetical protein BX600DRAFT_113042 [Xylariales sp. PMI_506]